MYALWSLVCIVVYIVELCCGLLHILTSLASGFIFFVSVFIQFYNYNTMIEHTSVYNAIDPNERHFEQRRMHSFHIHTYIHTFIYIHTYRQTDRQTDRQTAIYIQCHAFIHRNIEPSKQTNMHIVSHASYEYMHATGTYPYY